MGKYQHVHQYVNNHKYLIQIQEHAQYLGMILVYMTAMED